GRTATPSKRPHAGRAPDLQIFGGEGAQNHVQSWSLMPAPKTQKNAAVVNRLPIRSALRMGRIMANSSLAYLYASAWSERRQEMGRAHQESIKICPPGQLGRCRHAAARVQSAVWVGGTNERLLSA